MTCSVCFSWQTVLLNIFSFLFFNYRDVMKLSVSFCVKKNQKCTLRHSDANRAQIQLGSCWLGLVDKMRYELYATDFNHKEFACLSVHFYVSVCVSVHTHTHTIKIKPNFPVMRSLGQSITLQKPLLLSLIAHTSGQISPLLI